MSIGSRFKRRLSRKALHIDYLRLRCGREGYFKNNIKLHSETRAYIAFSEWDVVLFAPAEELYPENLINVYSDPELTKAIAGSAGYFSYVWKHPVNEGWEGRLLNPLGPLSQAHISMLVSLRFTDAFRARFGVAAEFLFCDFVQRMLRKRPGITAVIAHGLGWNDTTVVLKADEGNEAALVDVLTDIRYCKESDCCKPRSGSEACVVAATYSHLLGDLDLYVEQKLSFGTLADKVERARLLVRVAPSFEKDLRKRLESAFISHKIDGRIGTELGHYNFSADLSDAFTGKRSKRKTVRRADPVEIIQGFRDEVEKFMADHEAQATSFSETTTEITLKEDLSRAPTTRRMTAPPNPELVKLREIQARLKDLEGQASKLTRHRLAILLGTIETYLEDPVRGSVVRNLCRFIVSKYDELMESSDRVEQEDLCHILEYALHQATDGLSQFQHDANTLGLSGRGGWSRLIQALEQYMNELIDAFGIRIKPLLTFGLQPSHEATLIGYWVDIPFTTAFNAPRWCTLYHEIAHMCWAHLFDWRLEAFEVWKASTSSAIEIVEKESIGGDKIQEEMFPNYVMLNVISRGDLKHLDRLLISWELSTKPHPLLIRTLMQRMVLHATLDLHGSKRPRLSDNPYGMTLAQYRAAAAPEGYEKECEMFALGWWKAWLDLKNQFEAADPSSIEMDLDASIENAATSVREAVFGLKKERGFERSMHGADNIATLAADQVFKDDAKRLTRMVIKLLALQGEDYKSRSREVFSEYPYDPVAAQFGYVLAKIDFLADGSSGSTTENWSGYAKAMEEGWVFEKPAAGVGLSSVLASERMRAGAPEGKNRRKGDPMRSSLSAILSLWHVAAREQTYGETDTNDRRAAPADLKKLGLTVDFSY